MMRLPPRIALLCGTAAGAVLAASAAAPAAAQSFQGTPTVVTGSAAVSTGPSTTIITVATPETVINWAALDASSTGAIDFQPAGTTATFQTVPALTDYTVLNRILPVDSGGLPIASTVSFNGTVNSVIVNNPGGQIWFYSPTGIIAGPTARFNVGSLILTTDNIAFVPNPAGGFGSIRDAGGAIHFNGTASPTGFVDLRAGAQASASGTNAYVALVAPRVVQRGLVQANGQIAYVAAEQVDMTVNGGLFDFTVTVGTTDPDGIVHTGTTTGPASTSAADAQRIAMVAVPKNDALTMLLSGSIGYTPAASVANEGSTVVLAAGFATATPSTLPASGLGSIQIGDSTISNDLTGWATSGIVVAPTTGAATFGGNVVFNAADSIQIAAEVREQVTVAGDMRLTAGVIGSGGTIGLTGFTTGGQPGGLIDVTGDLIIDASSNGIFSDPPPADGQGGTVSLLADGGTISAEDLFVDAFGVGQYGAAAGGIGTGGQVSASVGGGGTISADIVTLYAYGAGGGSDQVGGDGIGGAASVTAIDGTLDFGLLLMNAGGAGGSGVDASGDGLGGTATITIASGSHDWDALLVNADATAGGDPESGAPSGSATADAQAIDIAISQPGRLTVRGDVTLTANAVMGTNGPAGFTGHAGGISLAVNDFGSLAVEGTLLAHANAEFDADVDLNPDRSPTQIGGSVLISANSGSMTLNDVDAAAEAVALSGVTAAGAATGGQVTVSALNSGSIGLSNALGTARLALSANAYGSPGPHPGDATAGRVDLIAEDASITVAGNADLTADARIGQFFAPPPGGDGFDAAGGVVRVSLAQDSLGTAYIGTGNLSASAVGDSRVFLAIGTLLPGGEPIQGSGGDGTGGDVRLVLDVGDFFTNALSLEASGAGGASAASDGLAAFQSGAGTGGLASLAQNGGTLTASTIDVLSEGLGGGGATAASARQRAALAGAGSGGTALLALAGGTLTTFDITLSATGTGGDGMDHVGTGDATDGGDGLGGTAQLQALGGWAGSANSTTLVIDADGIGGVGGLAAGASSNPPTATTGDGGDGTGGRALVDLADGAFSFGAVRVESTGVGGYSGDASSGISGGDGGEGFGGTAEFVLNDSPAGPVGDRRLDSLFIDAGGVGGFGSTAIAQSHEGAAVLTVDVLDASAALAIVGDLSVYNSATAFPGPTGILATIAGSPLTVGGFAVLSTTRALEVDAQQTLRGIAGMTLAGQTVHTQGLIQGDGGLYVTGYQLIDADRLASGDITQLQSPVGDIFVDDLQSAGLVYVNGASVDIASLGTLSFATLSAFGGPISVRTVGDLDVDSVDAAGALTLRSTAGVVTGTGLIDVGAATIDGQIGVSLAALDAAGETHLLSAGGTVDVDSLAATGPVEAVGRSVDIAGTGALAFSDAQATAGDLRIANQAGLTLARATATGAVDLSSANAAIAATGPVTAGGNASVVAPLGVTLPVLTSGGTTLLRATGGAVDIDSLTSAGAVTALGRTVDIASPGGLSFADLDATAGALSVLTAGDLTVATADALAAASLRSSGGVLRVGSVDAGSVQLTAATAIQADTQLLSRGTIAVDAGTGFTLGGLARGTAITVLSNDIAIAPTASLGARGTTLDLTLANRAAARTTIVGGAADPAGYSLDQAEIARLFADRSVAISGLGAVAVRSFALTYGAAGQIGSGGELEISTPAQVAITDAVNLTTSTAGDAFTIDPTRIELNTDAGSIALLGAGGAPLGRLAMIGDTIASATGAALAQLATLTDFAAINALLDAPGGAPQPLRAGAMTFDVTGALYIQSTGTSAAYADRRGFAAETLDIATAAPTTRLSINGQILTPGGPVSGLDTAPLVRINGAVPAAGGRFDPASTINGCVIGANCAVPPRPLAPEPPSDTDLLRPLPDDAAPPSLFVAPIIELAENDPLVEPPLVDEPITGIGNDDLWEPPCPDAAEDGTCREADGRP